MHAIGNVSLAGGSTNRTMIPVCGSKTFVQRRKCHGSHRWPGSGPLGPGSLGILHGQVGAIRADEVDRRSIEREDAAMPLRSRFLAAAHGLAYVPRRRDHPLPQNLCAVARSGWVPCNLVGCPWLRLDGAADVPQLSCMSESRAHGASVVVSRRHSIESRHANGREASKKAHHRSGTPSPWPLRTASQARCVQSTAARTARPRQAACAAALRRGRRPDVTAPADRASQSPTAANRASARRSSFGRARRVARA